MIVLENVPLSGYSTMRLGGPARYLTEITAKQEVSEAYNWAKSRNLPVIMIGVGSNILWRDDGFEGLVIVNKLAGFEVFEEDKENAYVTVAAGENWDETVARIVEKGYSGVEELSLIPGNVGATPVQNVGAYGREIKDCLTTVEAFDTTTQQLATIAASDCNFAYRSSRFNSGPDKGRYFITSITLHVMKTTPTPPFYATLQSYLDDHKITSFSPQIIRDAVVAIRSAKLPDPKLVANCGSFFYNPIIDEAQHKRLLVAYPNMMYWPMDNGKVKVSAAWLLEEAGFKDVYDDETGVATWSKQPLVFVNQHANHTKDILAFKQKVTDKVEKMFGISLVQEPQLLP